MAAGLALTAAGVGGLEVDSASFRESLAAGGAARLALGPSVFTADSVNVNPLFAAGWAGLIINAINMLPAGEAGLGFTCRAVL